MKGRQEVKVGLEQSVCLDPILSNDGQCIRSLSNVLHETLCYAGSS